MPRVENGEEYLNGEEVMNFWPASKNLFYGSIQPRLQPYHFDGKKRPHYYKKSEVLALKSGKPVTRREPITLSGIFGDWTVYLRSLGYQAETRYYAIETTTLTEEVSSTFHISTERQFVRRSRMTLANGVPICVWSTYYPLELIEGEILSEMKQDPTLDIIQRIREIHGIVVEQERVELLRIWRRGEEKDATLKAGGFHEQNATSLHQRVQAAGSRAFQNQREEEITYCKRSWYFR